MVLIDTGPVVALFDKSDTHHATCVETLREIDEPLVTTWPVLTECMYLLDFSDKAQQLCWVFLATAPVEIAVQDIVDAPLLSKLMKKYSDLPMSLADASLVHAANERGLRTIFALDSDFQVYRLRGGKGFEVIPGS